MATHLGRRNAVLPIHFFKIILQTNVERIKMPNTFTRIYGGGLLNPVCLRPPDFGAWEVHWTKENGEIWFEKGWKEFVQNYSLNHGHLVLFKYEGTSKIDVLILDQSALEIDYLLSADSDDEMGTLDQSVESVKIVEKIPPEQKARPKSPLISPLSRRRRSRGKHGNVERHFNQKKLHADAGVHRDQGTKFSKNRKHDQPEDVKTTKRRTSLNMPKPARAQELTKNFESNNPFFTLVIKQSHLEKNATKHVPKFLDIESNEQNVMLKTGKRSWCVKFIYAPNRNYDRFDSGWSLFAKESKLQAGDICIFELIDRDVLLFEVHVTKASST